MQLDQLLASFLSHDMAWTELGMAAFGVVQAWTETVLLSALDCDTYGEREVQGAAKVLQALNTAPWILMSAPYVHVHGLVNGASR